MTLPEIKELAASARRYTQSARDTLDAGRYASTSPLLLAAINEAREDARRAHERMCELMRALGEDADGVPVTRKTGGR